MGLFNKKAREIRQEEYRVYMNRSGKKADGPKEMVIVRDESEFMAVRAAEKKFPHLRVYWIEKNV